MTYSLSALCLPWISVWAGNSLRVEFERLLVDHILEDLLRWLEIVPCPVECFLALRLSLLIMKSFEVGVLQTLLDRVALLRVENQHFREKVQRYRVRLWIQRLPRLLVALREFANVFPRKVIANKGHVFTSRGSEHSYSTLDLIQVVVTGEEWSST